MPISAPISACEELEGSPARHVKRFQVIAPNSTAMSIDIATPPAGATRLPTVFATSAWRNCVVTIAPTRFKMAVKPTANLGGNARVPIGVPRDRVAPVLQPMDFGVGLFDTLAGLQFAYRFLELGDRPREESCQLMRRLRDGRDPVQVSRVGNLLDVV